MNDESNVLSLVIVYPSKTLGTALMADSAAMTSHELRDNACFFAGKMIYQFGGLP